MFDLMLDYNGDLSFEEIEKSKKPLLINFALSKTKSLKIDFYVENKEDRRHDSGLLINFITYKVQNNKKEVSVVGYEYMQQAIRIRLSSVLGTISGNEDIGSKLQLLKHRFVDDASVEGELKAYVAEAISDIIERPTIYVRKAETVYMQFTNKLQVIIVDNGRSYDYYI